MLWLLDLVSRILMAILHQYLLSDRNTENKFLHFDATWQYKGSTVFAESLMRPS